MQKFYFLVSFLFFFSATIDAQVNYEKRIEIELKDGYITHDLYEFGQAGFILFSEKEKSQNEQTEWKFEKFNSDLERVEETKIYLSKKQSLDESFTDDERLYIFCKDRKGNFSLVTLEINSLETNTIEGFLPKKSFIKDMAIFGDYAVFNASIKRSPFLYSINWKTGERKLTPIRIAGFNPRKTTLLNFQLLENSREIFAYARAVVDKRNSEFHVIRLNNKGEKQETYKLNKSIEENIIDATASKINSNTYIFTGTYSTKFNYTSEGLFFSQVKDNEIEFIEFYNFLDLENFLSYLPERKQQKIEKKKQRKEKKDKELKINYHIEPHDLMPLEDGYLMLAEAYYPTYRSETRTTTTTVNGVTTTNTTSVSVFDGYQYTHAILSKFDKNGKMIWDNIFEMQLIYKPYYVDQFISIAEFTDQSIKLVFANGKKIASKSIDFTGKVLQDFESEDIETNFEGDKTKRSYSSIIYWYNDYFIAFGSQKIKNTEEDPDVKRKRKVYFVSKVKF
jgi:hypothetical protein